jgi:flagellin
LTFSDGTTQTAPLTDGMSALLAKTPIDSAAGVTTTATYATNSVTVDFAASGSWSDVSSDEVTLTIGNGSTTTDLTITATSGNTFIQDLATALGDTMPGAVTLLSDGTSTGVVFSSTTGENIELSNLRVSGSGTTAVSATYTGTSSGTLTTSGSEAYVQRSGVSYDVDSSADLASVTSNGDALGVDPNTEGLTSTGVSSSTGGNNVVAQTLTIVGPDDTQDVIVETDDDAYTIAHNVNLESSLTGVTAEARTTATISDLSTDGTISFALQGSNTEAIEVSATVTTDDLEALAKSINEQSGNTGIIATLSGDKKSIDLVQSEGYDIKIGDYSHSGNLAADTISVTGNEGARVVLAGNTGSSTDSTVIGGEVTFYSTGNFNISSSLDNSSGSLFSTASGVANASDLYSVDTIDISTVEGATEAIKAIDGAISQIDDLRGLLGAIQNRFESTISNLLNVSENLSAARSRILDADVAQETSNMTKNNILQQAGVSILTQANQTPQLALQLLQG